MRIHILSDLHFEVCKMSRTYRPPECDVVVLAGDICTGLPGVIWAADTFTVPVVYVPGNHEHWVHRPWRENLAKMQAKVDGTNVHILNNETIEILGVRFIGATLWSDFDLFGQNFFHQVVAQQGMGDYVNIWNSDRVRFTAEDSLNEHINSRFYINEELRKPFAGKTVVCTHHGPSALSVAPRWSQHELTPAYTSRMENMILDYQPELWVHGHTHDSFDYKIDQTRVLTNPRGYGTFEINPLYDQHLVIDL